MEILSNPLIQPVLTTNIKCNLSKNNDRLNVIIPIINNSPIELEKFINDYLEDGYTKHGYYYLYNLFKLSHMNNPMTFINIIISIINQKIDVINNTLYTFDGTNYVLDQNINIEMYIQVWQYYRKITKKIYCLAKIYQNYLTEKKIKIGNYYQNLLSIIQLCMYHQKIIRSDAQIINNVSQNLYKINSNNVEHLINYICSITNFISVHRIVQVNDQTIISIVKKIMSQPEIINEICAYQHKLLVNFLEQSHENIQKKIIKVCSILANYAEKDKLEIYYTKFMQARIIDLKYDNFQTEIKLLNIIKSNIGTNATQRLMDALSDMINTKNIIKHIHSAEIIIKSPEYQKIETNPSILNPIILSKKSWTIFNTSEMGIVYPIELQYNLDIISKLYDKFYDSKYIIEWKPTLGTAQFIANLNGKDVHITCNILQSILLFFFNDYDKLTVDDFSAKTMINKKLASKIFESLYEANIIVFTLDRTCDSYMVNNKMYTNNTEIDLIKYFIDTFEKNTDDTMSKK